MSPARPLGTVVDVITFFPSIASYHEKVKTTPEKKNIFTRLFNIFYMKLITPIPFPNFIIDKLVLDTPKTSFGFPTWSRHKRSRFKHTWIYRTHVCQKANFLIDDPGYLVLDKILKSANQFHYFQIISHWNGTLSFYYRNLQAFYPRVLCFRFG